VVKSLRDDPQHWRQRAEQARAQAGHMHGPEARRQMLQFAEHYERLAKQAQERSGHKTNDAR